MKPNAKHLLATLDSPFKDPRLLLADGNTLADDLAAQGGGGTITKEEEGSDLLGDLEGFDPEKDGIIKQEEPQDLLDEYGEEEIADPLQKRLSDAQRAFHEKTAENAKLLQELETLKRQRFQPQQPNILQPGQTGDPLAHLEQEFQVRAQRLKDEYMDKIRNVNRQDPKVQEKVAGLWDEYGDKRVELKFERQERKNQLQYELQQEATTGYDMNMSNALREAGYDPMKHKDDFLDRVAIMNRRTPGWDRGMDPYATFQFVVNQMKESGVAPQNQNPNQLTPLQQHQQLRRGAAGNLRAGTRTDPTRPSQQSKGKEVKDVNFITQMKLDKRRRTVTPEQHARMRELR